MTQVKVGRFICDSAADIHRGMHSRSNHQRVRRVFHDDVIPAISSSRANSTGNVEGFSAALRKFSLPNIHNCGWEVADDGGEQELLEVERGMEAMESAGKDRMDDYSHTLRPQENDRLSNLFRALQLNDGWKEEYESIDRDAVVDEKEEEEEENEEEEEAADAVLPWRSKEQMDVLEDSSKYLRSDDDDLATPLVKNLALDDDDEGPRLDPVHHSSSFSSLSSFRNAAAPGRGVARPDLSNCQSLSLSHWLSEAESRHSEPFCPQHHHVLDAASMTAPSIRSSVDHRIGRQRTDCPAAAQRDHSSSEGASIAVVIATDDDDWTMNRHAQVLHWLMSNDLAERLDEEEEKDDDGRGHDLSSLDPSCNIWPNETPCN